MLTLTPKTEAEWDVRDAGDSVYHGQRHHVPGHARGPGDQGAHTPDLISQNKIGSQKSIPAQVCQLILYYYE